MKKINKRVMSLLLCLTMLFSSITPIIAEFENSIDHEMTMTEESNQVSEESIPQPEAIDPTGDPVGQVTVTVEKFTLGLGYIQEPIKVPFYEGEYIGHVVARLLGEGNYNKGVNSENISYLAEIKAEDTRPIAIPSIIAGEIGEVVENSDEWLGQFDYTQMSGWMYIVNNVPAQVGMGQYECQDNDVIRLQFTMGMGSDIGIGWGENWVTVANKDDLTKKIAEINEAENKNILLSNETVKKYYDKAMIELETLDIAQEIIDKTLKGLNKAIEDINQPSSRPIPYYINNAGERVDLDNNNTITIKGYSEEGIFQLEGYEGQTNGEIRWSTASEGFDDSNKPLWIGLYNGALWIKSSGTATVTISAKDGTALASFTLVVEPIEIEDIRLSIDGEDVTNGTYQVNGSERKQVKVEIRTVGEEQWITALPIEIEASSSHKEIMDVSQSNTGKGSFSFLKPGEATLSISHVLALDKKKTVTITSNYVPVESIKANLGDVYLLHARNPLLDGTPFVGIHTMDLHPVVTPANASYAKEITWESSNKEVATYQATYGNGFVTYKSGKTIATVSCEGKTDTKEIEFQYQNPVTSMNLEENGDAIILEEGAQKQFNPTFLPDDASEMTMEWTYSQNDVVAIDAKNKLTAIVPGTVTVTGMPKDKTNTIEAVTFTVTVNAKPEVPVDYNALIKDAMEKTHKNYLMGNLLSNQEKFIYSNEWSIFSAIRSGIEAKDLNQTNYDAYYNNIVKAIEENSINKKGTEWARIALTLGVIGNNATVVGETSYNFIDSICNEPKLDGGSNDLAWALIALDSRNYTVPQDALWTREKIITTLLTKYQNPKDGGFLLFAEGAESGVDITAMVIQALANYQDQEAVRNATEKALDYLRSKMSAQGGFMDSGNYNCESVAQVLTALTSLGLDPLDASNGFVKGKNNILKNLLSFYGGWGKTTGFVHVAEDLPLDPWEKPTLSAMASQQAMYALASYNRMKTGKAGIYDFSDIRDLSKPVDKAALEEKIQEAENMVEEKYTPESFVRLQQAIATAKIVVAQPILTWGDVDQQVGLLQNAIEQLKEKVAGVLPEVRERVKEELKTGIDFTLCSETATEAIYMLLKSGEIVPEAEAYYTNLKTYVKENKIKTAKEYFKTVLFIDSMGGNVEDIDGVNLIEKICNLPLQKNNILELPCNSGLDIAYTLMTLQLGYVAPENCVWNEASLKQALLTSYQMQIGVKRPGAFLEVENKYANASIQVTALARIVLSKYAKDEALKFDTVDSTKPLERTVGKILEETAIYLDMKQAADGTMLKDTIASADENTSMVIIALSTEKINPDTEPQFIKYGNSLMGGLLSFYNEKNTRNTSNLKQAVSVYSAIAAYDRLMANKKPIYEATGKVANRSPLNQQIQEAKKHAEKDYTVESYGKLMEALKNAEAAYEIIDVAQASLDEQVIELTTAIKALVKIPSDPGKPETTKYVTISVDAKTIGQGYLMDAKKVEIKNGDSAYDVLEKTVGKSNLKTTGVSDDGSDKYVASMKFNGTWLGEFDKGKDSGWMYSVNGKFPGISCGAYQLEADDVVAWRYTTNLGADLGNEWPGDGGSTGGTGGGTTSKPPTTTEKPSTTEKVNFTDIEGWYADYINDLAMKGIVKGKTANTFAPNDSITRAEFVAILANVAKVDLSQYKKSIFIDINTNDWYFSAITWAEENKIVNGFQGKANPMEFITREDMAVMISRYMKNVAKKELKKSEEPITFIDQENIADYAKGAVQEMQRANIINGKGNNTFAPKDKATRAEATKMIYELLKHLEG